MKSDPYLTPLPKINSTWIRDINIRQPTDWEMIFANHTSDEGLKSKIYKNFYNSIAKQLNK